MSIPLSELGPHHPLSRKRGWVTPPPQPRGGHAHLRVMGWGSPNSDDWKKALCLLCEYRYLPPAAGLSHQRMGGGVWSCCYLCYEIAQLFITCAACNDLSAHVCCLWNSQKSWAEENLVEGRCQNFVVWRITTNFAHLMSLQALHSLSFYMRSISFLFTLANICLWTCHRYICAECLCW